MKVSIHKAGGRTYHVLDFGERNGERERRYFLTPKAANDAMRDAKREIELAGRWWATLPIHDKQDYIATIKEMRAEGLDPRDVWKAYKNREFTCHERRTLSEAITETITAKREANRKKRYVDELEKYLRKFAKDREDLPIERITPADIDKWFAGRKEASETRRSNLGRLSSLFGLCHRRGYIPSNPCKAAEAVSEDRKPPVILPVATLERMLKLCRKHTPALLRYVILGGIVGLRPDEIQAMPHVNVNLKQKRVKVDFHSTKIRAWRIIDLPQPALRWLKVCPKSHGMVAPKRSTLRRMRRKLRERVGLPSWPQDVLRHTAASHLLAFYDGDETKVAAMLGTSPRKLHERYKSGLVTKQDAKRFMALRPSY